jgi:hypothetical protein
LPAWQYMRPVSGKTRPSFRTFGTKFQVYLHLISIPGSYMYPNVYTSEVKLTEVNDSLNSRVKWELLSTAWIERHDKFKINLICEMTVSSESAPC